MAMNNNNNNNQHENCYVDAVQVSQGSQLLLTQPERYANIFSGELFICFFFVSRDQKMCKHLH